MPESMLRAFHDIAKALKGKRNRVSQKLMKQAKKVIRVSSGFLNTCSDVSLSSLQLLVHSRYTRRWNGGEEDGQVQVTWGEVSLERFHGAQYTVPVASR